MATINADTFAVRLTRDERDLIEGRTTRRDPLRVTSRDFTALAGRVSRGKQRGTYTVYA